MLDGKGLQQVPVGSSLDSTSLEWGHSFLQRDSGVNRETVALISDLN